MAALVMRETFCSERRLIESMIREHCAPSSGWAPCEVRVVEEWYASPRLVRGGCRFNTDFCLGFGPRSELPSGIRSVSTAVLPNTMGVDVFLVVEPPSFRPWRLELLGGEGLSIRYFRRHVDRLRARLGELLGGAGHRAVADTAVDQLRRECGAAELLRSSDPKRAQYFRLIVTRTDACFLFYPHEISPRVAGERRALWDTHDGAVHCYVENGTPLCFDGWLAVETTSDSEWKLEAIST